MAKTAVNAPSSLPVFLSLKAVADRCAVSYLTAWRWNAQGRWQGARRAVTGQHLIPESAVSEFLASGLKRPPLPSEASEVSHG